MNNALILFLREHAENVTIQESFLRQAAERFQCSAAEVEQTALASGLLPLRYQRNGTTLPLETQKKLFASHVAVIGCGGLGGTVIEQLARAGVGTLTLVDPDTFEDSNLNRQLLSSTEKLGVAKAVAGAERVQNINPAVTVHPKQIAFGKENYQELIAGCSVVVDALDNAEARRVLSRACAELDIPLVHGAISGWYGQVAVQMPGSRLVENLYANKQAAPDMTPGNPSFTPIVVAGMQVAEVCKIIAGHEPLQGVLIIDLLRNSFERVPLAERF